MITDPFSAQLDGRIPYRMKITPDGELRFTWIYIGDKSYSEPFFDETIARCLSLPENAVRPFPETSEEQLIKRAQQLSPVPLGGIIHHISRCGSTLLAQMLTEDTRFTVLSEVPLLDELLMLHYRGEKKKGFAMRELFDAVLRLLADKAESIAFIKTDSWHIHFHDVLREWYQDVPVFLLFRNPGEVIRSHQRQPGMHAVPGLLPAQLFGMNADEVIHMTLPAYLDRVLISYLEKYNAILAEDRNAHALNYHDGALAIYKQLLSACNIATGNDSLSKIERRSAFHSKHPGQQFSGDGEQPAICSEELRNLFLVLKQTLTPAE